VTVRENLDHGRRITPQPPSLPAGWYCARRAWNGGFPAASAFAAPAAALRLPARGNIVIRNAYVMTMEPGAPDIKAGDVVEIELTGIGTLRNKFVAETA